MDLALKKTYNGWYAIKPKQPTDLKYDIATSS